MKNSKYQNKTKGPLQIYLNLKYSLILKGFNLLL